jgi:hypothetical protein
MKYYSKEKMEKYHGWYFDPDIIRYQSRNVIYPVLKGSGFVKRFGCKHLETDNIFQVREIIDFLSPHCFPEVLQVPC